jgi:hypothetical protein
VLKAFETLKNNVYSAFDPTGFEYNDPIGDAIAGNIDLQDAGLYRFNNNIYQMLCLSFIAALSPEVIKSRYMPDDADSEIDISTARRASTVVDKIERDNNIKSLQKQELLHLWTGGVYFSYTRNVIDSNRAGVTKEPLYGLVEKQVIPDRFVCPECGDVVDANSVVFRRPVCENCGYNLTPSDFYPAESMPVPSVVGKQEIPNSMVMESIFGVLQVDVAPYAQDLFETPILDLEVEVDVSGVRAAYPKAWEKVQPSATTGSSDGDVDRTSRLSVFGESGARNAFMGNSMVTYSRCWITPEAFNKIEDQPTAEGLRKKFPKGCKLVSMNGIDFLDAIPERMADAWTECRTIRGMGMLPFAVGDAALDIQERINDVANIVHEHMDRNASPTILADEDAIDTDALNGKPMPAGSITGVKRKGQLAAKALSDLIFQPTFHVDAQIYNYGENLIQLAQLVSGVQPQIFGGSDPNVKTAQGQNQMLNTALGRLSLFYDQQREEHATRSNIAVKCFAQNMDDEVRYVIEGDTESGFENEYILLTEMQGSIHAYPETDQGFPSSYAEVRDRMMQMLSEVNNPFVMEYMEDPDNWKVVARYVAPPGTKLPGDDERSKIKRILGQLSKEEPMEIPWAGRRMPMYLPSVMPDRDFDDMNMIVQLAKKWGQKHYQLATTDPLKFENVRAYLRLASQYASEAEARRLLRRTRPAPHHLVAIRSHFPREASRVPELVELRCTCKDRHGRHPLLAKAGGGSFVVEIKCRACKKLKTFQHPHPLSPKK